MMEALAATCVLSDAPPKTVLRVERVEAACDDARRLQALGVCIGRRLELIQRGDPLIVRVLGSRVGISARLAEQVHVSPQ